MNARARMQTAGSGEIAGSRVGGLSSCSCEAIRSPLKLWRHAGRWRMAAAATRGCSADSRSTRGVLQVGIRSRLRHSTGAIQTAAVARASRRDAIIAFVRRNFWSESRKLYTRVSPSRAVITDINRTTMRPRDGSPKLSQQS